MFVITPPADPIAACRIALASTLAAFAWAAVLLAGCSTHQKRLASPRASFYANQLPAAEKQLSKLIEKPKSDANVIELDLAMVELLRGDIASAERRLQQVRDTWDHLEQKSLAESAASYITDDHQRAYSGEDYERLMIRIMLTLCSLMQDGVDAESYSLQTLAKQQQLLEKARERWDEELAANYCIPPLAPYLRGVLREATHRDYDAALRSYQQTASLLPESTFLQNDIERAQHGVHSQPGYGIVYVIAMVGRGPYKQETNHRPSQAALQAADLIVSSLGKYSVPPTLASVKIPELVSPEKPFDLVGVEVNGNAISTTLPITDLHYLATQSYAIKRPEVVARAVARRVVKKGAIYAAKDKLNVSTDLASVAMDAAGVLWEATEAADTRCWGLLPREIQILRLELPAGVHQIRQEPVTAGRPIGPAVACDVTVRDGQNSYILSYWPGIKPIGQVLVSGRSEATP